MIGVVACDDDDDDDDDGDDDDDDEDDDDEKHDMRYGLRSIDIGTQYLLCTVAT